MIDLDEVPIEVLRRRLAEVNVLQDVWNYTRHWEANRHETAGSFLDGIRNFSAQLSGTRREQGIEPDYFAEQLRIEQAIERRVT